MLKKWILSMHQMKLYLSVILVGVAFITLISYTRNSSKFPSAAFPNLHALKMSHLKNATNNFTKTGKSASQKFNICSLSLS